jgi:hypothetical protein
MTGPLDLLLADRKVAYAEDIFGLTDDDLGTLTEEDFDYDDVLGPDAAGFLEE